MPTTGPNYPGTAASLANAGTSEDANAWTNVADVGQVDGGAAYITAPTFDSPDISEIIVASNFGFTVTGTVLGITVEISKRGYTSTNSGKDFRVQLATGTTFSNLVGDNKASADVWPQTTRATTTYGGSADTWNASLTAAQVSATGFAVFVSAYANVANADIDVDFIRVTVVTSEATSANAEVATGTASANADTATIEARGTGYGAGTGEAYTADGLPGAIGAAGVGEATGAAYGMTSYVAGTLAAAAATGSTQAAWGALGVYAGLGESTGAALDATADTGTTTFNAECATATAAALAGNVNLAASLGFAQGRSS